MRFGLMPLTEICCVIGTRCVEVAKADGIEIRARSDRFEHLLYHQLGLPVDVDGCLGVCLVN